MLMHYATIGNDVQMTDYGVHRPFRGVSAERRRAERRDKLVEAAIELIATQGLAGTKIKDVTDRAGVSPRYFYESFPDLETLLLTMVDDLIGKVIAAIPPALAAAPDTAQGKAEAAITGFIRTVEANRLLFTAGFIEAPRNEAVRVRMHAASDALIRIAAEQAIESYQIPIVGRRQMEFAARMVVNGSVATIGSWVQGEFDASPEELIQLFTDHYAGVGEYVAAKRSPEKRD